MSEVTSFGNIVSSLRSVRADYNEQLKSVPQYGAFLLFESSTQTVADTLRGVTAEPSMAGEVIAALETANAKFKQHLASVAEYRALMAIDKLIDDISTDLGVELIAENAAPPVEAELPVPEVAAPLQVEPVVHEQEAVSETTAAELADSHQEVAEQSASTETPETAQPADAVAELPSVEPAVEAPPDAAVAEQEPAPVELSQPAVAEHAQATEPTAEAPVEAPVSSSPAEHAETFEPAEEKAA